MGYLLVTGTVREQSLFGGTMEHLVVEPCGSGWDFCKYQNLNVHLIAD
jgi:hypothetical protein